MEASLLTLKKHLHTYRKLDEDLKELNAKAQEIRRERKDVEAGMSSILSLPEFQQYDKLEIKEDGSMVKIQRPGTWTKGWTMSKSELMDGLDLYFSKHDGYASAEGCYEFLVERQKSKMVANEFAFDRTIPSPPSKKMRM